MHKIVKRIETGLLAFSLLSGRINGKRKKDAGRCYYNR